VTRAQIGEHSDMEGIDGRWNDDTTSQGDAAGREDGMSGPGSVTSGPQDPAASAASLIAEQARSIFQAVEATTSDIDARARAEAEEIRRGAEEAVARASGRLEAMSRDLNTVSMALDRAVEDRSAGFRHGE
jgi:hypothetical protein